MMWGQTLEFLAFFVDTRFISADWYTVKAAFPEYKQTQIVLVPPGCSHALSLLVFGFDEDNS